MLLLLASIFFADPAPLDMPRAEAYLVSDRRTMRLEDRFDRLDLWESQTVVGRWTDGDGRAFLLARLEAAPPAVEEHGTVTRAAYREEKVPMKRVRVNADIPTAFRRSIALLAEVPLCEDKPRPTRQLPRGYADVDYWHHPTNYSSIVCAFLPEKTKTWYLAVWRLAENDDYAERMNVFEDAFLGKEFPAFFGKRPAESDLPPSERDLLRADVRHSVAAYPNWHFSDSEEFAIVDNLPTRGFVTALTNEFAVMRKQYAAAMPTPIDGTNVLCVARLYATRGEYLDAMEMDGNTNMMWTAAYWSPVRRELVAYLPERGEDALAKTIRHEAFHQYLSYATSMIPASPWLNEGYAQYFEDTNSLEWELDDVITLQRIDEFAQALPGVMIMDYDQFYAGSEVERRLNYRLAWSMAVFLEKGADKVRFRPFANLKRDYVEALFKTKDMKEATTAAFHDADRLKLFVSEWKKFWKNR